MSGTCSEAQDSTVGGMATTARTRPALITYRSRDLVARGCRGQSDSQDSAPRQFLRYQHDSAWNRGILQRWLVFENFTRSRTELDIAGMSRHPHDSEITHLHKARPLRAERWIPNDWWCRRRQSLAGSEKTRVHFLKSEPPFCKRL